MINNESSLVHAYCRFVVNYLFNNELGHEHLTVWFKYVFTIQHEADLKEMSEMKVKVGI